MSVNHFIEQHQAWQHDASQALASLRTRGAAAMQSQGFPTRKTEDWKYVSLDKWSATSFQVALEGQTASDNTNIGVHALAQSSTRIVFVDGVYQSSQSTLPTDNTVTVMPVAQALAGADETLLTQLGQRRYLNAFSAMNDAFLQQGVMLTLSPQAQLKAPIEFIYVASAQFSERAQNIRNIIRCGQHAQAQIIESYVAESAAPYFTNTQTEVYLQAGAQLAHVKLIKEGAQATHVGHLFAFADKDSSFESHSYALGGEIVRSDTSVRLQQSGASAKLHGLFMPRDKQTVDHHTTIEHVAAHCTSDQYYRGVMRDASTGVFNGKIHVHHDAQKTQSTQYSKNLLLDERATINTKPELEIYADDVKCAHGATVGSLDEAHIFYLRSRGIPEAQARQLLTSAFANDTISHLPSDALQTHIRESLQGALS